MQPVKVLLPAETRNYQKIPDSRTHQLRSRAKANFDIEFFLWHLEYNFLFYSTAPWRWRESPGVRRDVVQRAKTPGLCVWLKKKKREKKVKSVREKTDMNSPWDWVWHFITGGHFETWSSLVQEGCFPLHVKWLFVSRASEQQWFLQGSEAWWWF